MPRMDATREVCYDNIYIDNYVDVGYNVRTFLSVVTAMLAPGYITLSFLAILSRHNKLLKELSSHGKTSTKKNTIEKNTLPTPSWCWISKRRFVHFYLVGIISTVVTTVYHYNCCLKARRDQRFETVLYDETLLSRVTAVILLVIHVCRRAYECLYIQQYSDDSSKMHIAGYTLGVGYYLVLPLVFWDIDVTYSSAVLDGNSYSHDENHSFGFNSIMTILIVGMSVLNLWLQYEQHMHHIILADIRRILVVEDVKKFDDTTNDDCKHTLPKHQNYSLPPYRRWFRFVLSPHYLAEILLYLSFALILEMAPSMFQNSSICVNTGRHSHEHSKSLGETIIYCVFAARRYRHWMLFLWVATNLTVSAMNNYDWYQSRFKEDDAMKRSNTSSFGSTTRSQRQAGSSQKRRAIFPKIL